MTMMSYDPFSTFDRILSRSGFGDPVGQRALGLPLDVYQRDNEFVIEVDVPGIDPDALDVTVERNTLSISGERPAAHEEGRVLVCERPHAKFSRQLFLGEALDSERLQASYERGVLRITIPISEKAQPRKVQVAAGEKSTPIEATSRDQGDGR